MLVVVRHGRTAWNAAGRFQGWADVPLDDDGLRQSELAASALRDLLGGDHPGRPVAVVSSDLQRATGTAEAIARVLGVEVEVDAALREVDVGRWEGLTRREVSQRFPTEYRSWSLGEDVRRGAGETLAEAGDRVAAALQAHLDSARGHLVVVGHGMSLQAALSVLAAKRVVKLERPAPHLGNAEYLALQDWRHDQNECLLSER